MDPAGLPLRAEQFYRDKRSTCARRAGDAASTRRARRVELGLGRRELATTISSWRPARGSGRSKRPGVDLDGVMTLRDIADAQAMRERLGAARRVVVDRRRLHRPGDRRHGARRSAAR